MSTTTEDIKARLNIVEIIGQYVRLDKAGAHWKARCPFHQEKTPSFMVNEERQMWHCFGCGKGGDVFAFVMESEGLEFREALKLLAERAGVDLPAYSRGSGAIAETKDRSLEILELTTKFFEKQLWTGDRGAAMLAYLRGRALADESLRHFRVGYAPDGWRHLLEFLLKRGYAAEEIERAGLAIKKSSSESQPSTLNPQPSNYYDRFRDRIMFPIRDLLGRVIGFSARVAPGGDESQAKYVNTPETEVYHKSRALYGIDLAKQSIKERQTALLVEGNVDVIALHQAGETNAIAVSGTALTDEQLKMIRRYAKTLRLFFDMDAAGQAAAWKSAALAYEHEFGVEVVALVHGKDAADMLRDDPDGLRRAVAAARPAPEHFLGRLAESVDLGTAGGKRAAAEKSAELFAHMKNAIERAHWVKAAAQRIGIEERLLHDLVERARREAVRGTNVTAVSPVTPFLPKTFGRRSEVLRESLVGIMFVEPLVRERVLAETREPLAAFLADHSLYFFLNTGERDPLALIEDRVLQEEASRLMFRTMELPVFRELEGAARATALVALAETYLADLGRELLRRDRLHDLQRAIEAARASGDRERERALLADFSAAVTQTQDS